jgi:hypothetical protein
MVATSIQPQSTQPQSTLPVVIKRLDSERWSAEIVGWPDARAEGVDREDVRRNLWDRISHLLVNADIVSVQLSWSEHPWMAFAGIWDESDVAGFAAEIDAERRHDDDLEQRSWTMLDA